MRILLNIILAILIMIFIPEGKDQTLACFEDEERLKLWNDTGYMQLAKYLKK